MALVRYAAEQPLEETALESSRILCRVDDHIEEGAENFGVIAMVEAHIQGNLVVVQEVPDLE